MTEVIMQILQLLIPTGGIASVIIWITSKKSRNARNAKEVHDTYKAMYEDVQKTLIELRSDNEKLYKAVSRLERAISRASACRHWDTCPIRSELLHNEKSKPSTGKGKNSNRQPRIRNPADDHDRSPGVEGAASDRSDEAAESSS